MNTSTKMNSISANSYLEKADPGGIPSFVVNSFNDAEGNLCIQLKILEGDYKGAVFTASAYEDNILRFSLLELPDNYGEDDEIDNIEMENLCSHLISKLVDDYPEKPH